MSVIADCICDRCEPQIRNKKAVPILPPRWQQQKAW